MLLLLVNSNIFARFLLHIVPLGPFYTVYLAGIILDRYLCGKDIYIYGRIRLDGYLTKQLGIFALFYVHIVDYSITFEVFLLFHLNLEVEASHDMPKYDINFCLF